MHKVLKQTLHNDERFDNICFKIIIIDVLFLPLFPLFSVSMSLPVIACWYLSRGEKTHKQEEYKILPVVVVIMALSTLIGSSMVWEVRWETTFATSVKRFFQFYTSFWYFLFFKYYYTKYDKRITPYIFWFVIYVAAIAVYYTMYKDQFVYYKAILNPADPHTRRFLEGSLYGLYRYTFLWSDANNVAYALGGISVFYCMEERTNYTAKYIVMCMTLFILLCTMSVGGIAVTAILSAIVFFFTSAFKSSKGKAVFSSIVSVLFIVILAIYFGDAIINTFQEGAGSRIEYYADDKNMTGGRMTDLMRTIPLMSPVFTFIGSGQEGFTSENGHLYLICMYGFLVYVYFLYLLFWKRKGISISRYLVVIPFFVGFTMNIAIIEQKYILLLLLISAYLSAQSCKCKLKHNKQTASTRVIKNNNI